MVYIYLKTLYAFYMIKSAMQDMPSTVCIYKHTKQYTYITNQMLFFSTCNGFYK